MNKFNKAKTIGLISASLAGVSLMGVGFAAWVINGYDNKTTGDIAVTVGEIEDQRVIFSELPTVGDNNSVKFDADTKYTGGLIGAKEKSSEDLTFNVTYTVKAYKSATNWKVTAKLIDEGSKFSTAISKKYIELPSTLSLTGADALSKPEADVTSGDTTIEIVSSDNDFTTYAVNQTFAFKWGKAFNNTNPCNVKENDPIWTGSKEENATLDKLLANLTDLKSLGLSKFTVEFSTVAA